MTGALCGLGFDRVTGQPLFPNHDLEVTFDTEITTDDIQVVNCLRYWMNKSLCTDDHVTPNTGPRDIVTCQNKIREFLFA